MRDGEQDVRSIWRCRSLLRIGNTIIQKRNTRKAAPSLDGANPGNGTRLAPCEQCAGTACAPCACNHIVQKLPPGLIDAMNDRFVIHSAKQRRRRGAVMSVELLLVLPIIVVMTIAAVQFGLLFTNLQQLSLAAREGASTAAELPGLPMINGAPVPPEVLEAIDDQLYSSGIERCLVRLEHNVGGAAVVLQSPPMADCDCGPDANLPVPPPGEYVRLTVCTELSEVMPNGLLSFGFDISGAGNTAESTMVLRYELTPP